MKNLIIYFISFFMISCNSGSFKMAESLLNEDLLEKQINSLKSSYLIKEMNFDSSDGLINGASILENEASLVNPTDNNQHIDTGISIKDRLESTLSVWIKTDDPNKIQMIFWQGVNTENGWGAGANDNTKAEFNITLNHYSDLTATVLSAFFGYNESSLSPDLMPVAFPVTRNPASGLFEVTGQRSVIDSNWTHIVSTIEQSGTSVTISTYINGQLIEQGSGEQVDTTMWNSNLLLGKAGLDGTRNFTGKMKKFLSFNKKLTLEEILSLYQYQSR